MQLTAPLEIHVLVVLWILCLRLDAPVGRVDVAVLPVGHGPVEEVAEGGERGVILGSEGALQ